MSCKTWITQSLSDTDQRTMRTGLQKSVQAAAQSSGPAACSGNEMIEGLWTSAARTGRLDEPDLHEALDRLMVRIRLT